MAENAADLPDSALHAALDAYEQADALELIHLDPPAPTWVGEDPPHVGIVICAYLTAQRVRSAAGTMERVSCGAAAALCDYHSHAVHRAARGCDVVTLMRCPLHRGRLKNLCRHCLHVLQTAEDSDTVSPYDLVDGYVIPVAKVVHQ